MRPRRSLRICSIFLFVSGFLFCFFNLLYSRIVESAISFASEMILWASSRASRSILSRFSFILSWRDFKLLRRVSISLRYSRISSCSFSIVCLLFSRSAKIVSKSLTDSSIWSAAPSMICSSNPNLREIANALLFPGIPIIRRYVGESVSTSNSQEAFSISSVESANILSSL